MAPRCNEPIAIIGSGCRFPGTASSPSRLWHLLRDPQDCLTEIPKDRFNWEGYHYAKGTRHGSSTTKYTHFLQEDIRKFDPQFFNIQPGEAEAIDPQQRLLLETVYEGLESAGLTIEGLQGSSTAVYVGMMGCDYADVVQGDIDCAPTYAGTGTARSIHSNRISYFYDWHGPSMTIDTACSSSMMALHLAIQSLRSGDSQVAVACGASLIISPQNYVILSNLNMIAADGRAKMWDASANGYARGEGVGAIILKTLSAAIADGDPIECVIRETSVNQDGRTRGITMPSSTAQADLIRKTYERAGLDVSKRDDRPQYFEAHGTGTMVGDPREAEAVHNAFFEGLEGLEEEDTIHIGSIKTVIGHTEGAAGLAGVLKASLALKNGFIPPNLLFNKLNPAVAPFAKHLRLPTALTPWPSVADGAPRRASVNSFGFGGSNGHAILESYEDTRYPAQSPELSLTQATPFVFSAQSERTLVSMMQRFSDYLESDSEIDLRSVAWTQQYKRSTFGVRTAIAALNQDDLLSKLKTKLGSTETNIGVKSSIKHDARILGVFTGQGAQWAGMGQELLRSSPKALEIVRSLDASLASLPREQDHPSWTIEEELMKDSEHSRIGEAAISQPLCTAVQVLLVDMLQSAGVRFHAVVGHSSGEIAAAYTANLITASDAIRIAYYRGLYAKLAGGQDGQTGAMMAAGLSLNGARELCELPQFHQRLSVAACNSSASITLSGDRDAIEEASVILDEDKKFTRVLKVDTAYHSHHMLPCAQPYLEALQACDIRPTDAEDSPVWLSSVHAGKPMSASSDLSGPYWVANMTQPVLFAGAIEAALATEGPFDLGLEVGPHPALQSPALQTIQDAGESKLPYTGVLSRGKNDVAVFAEALGTLWTYCDRNTVNFARYDQTFFTNATKVSFVQALPAYPWDHERSYWFEARTARAQRNRPGPVHSLLGVPYGDATDTEVKWRNFLIPKEIPWLSDHRLQGRAVLPGAAYAVMACEAALLQAQTQDVRLIEIFDLVIHRAISFDDETTGAETVLTLSNIERSGKGSETFTASWAVHSPTNKETDKLGLVGSGSVSLLLGTPDANLLPGRVDSLPNMVGVDVDQFYGALSELGYGYTGAFRSMATLQRKIDQSSGTFDPPPSDTIIHPAFLDMAFQALFAAVSYPGDGGLWSLHVPTIIRAIRMNPYHCRGDKILTGEMSFDATLAKTSETGATGDVSIYTEHGDGFLQVESVSSVPFTKATSADDRNIFSEEIWALADPDGTAVVTEQQATPEEIERAYACERASYFYLKRVREEISALEERNAALHHQRLLAWASHFVAEVNSGKRRYCKAEWANDTEDDILPLFERYPDDIDLKLIKSVGQAYPSVVRGESNPLEHLTIDNMLNRLYAEGLGFPVANTWAARLIKQLSHRYPHMNIVEIGAGTGGATEIILDHLGPTFKTYTYTDISTAFFERAQERFKHFSHKMVFKPFDMEKDADAQGYEQHSYDLVVASNVIHATKDMGEALQHVRSLLRPGGYLVLLELTDQEPSRIGFLMGGLPGWWQGEGKRKWAPTLPTAQWHSLLRKTGYSGIDTIAMSEDGLAYPFSVSISQAVDDRISFLRQPLFSRTTAEAELGDLLVIGGSTLESSRLTTEATFMLGQRFNTTTIETLEEVNALEEDLPTTILVLTELDEPIFKNMSSGKLQAVKTLFSSDHNVLWVTRGSKNAEPYSNMTIGIGRSASSEQKELRLQFIDVEQGTSVDARRLCEMLLTLRATQLWEREGTLEQVLWTTEPEFYVEKNQQLIPRMYHHHAQNNRYNSKQRQISYEVAPRTDRVCISYSEASRAFKLVNDDNPKGVSSSDYASVRVLYSPLSSIKLPGGQYIFPIIGRNVDTDETVLALSASNTSVVDIPKEYVVSVNVPSGQEKGLLLRVIQELLVQAVLSNTAAGGSILTLGVEAGLFEILRVRAIQQGKSVHIVTDDPGSKGPSSIVIHPLEFKNLLKAKLPLNVSSFLDLSTETAHGSLHKRLVDILPAFCEVLTPAALFSSTTSKSYHGSPPRASLHDLLAKVSLSAQEVLTKYGIQADDLTHSLKQVPQITTPDPFTIVDWAIDALVPVDVAPVDRGVSFSADKTYLLIGLTGDLGQSLCEWFVQHGARHLVLTSRNPKIGQKWLDTMKFAGANVKVCAMDITNKASLQAVYKEVSETLPPIAGVANAAMVLQDIMLSNMELDDLLAVLRPKVDGSRYLDEVFSNHPLDFFILFSSLGLIVGNSGQSNYAAANAFMASLVAQRRQRGQAGSVMHIGAIIGAGYITRAGQIKSGDLAAYGAYPLSASDFHQLFGEAVLASPPQSGRNPDIVTGLRTIDPEVDDRVLWRSNPKFSHFWKVEEELQTDGDAKRSVAPVKVQLADATSKAQARKIIQECFSARLVVLLQLQEDDMDDNAPLVELGVDSLVAVEARSWFTKQLNVDISVLRILGGACVVDLVEDTLERIGSDLLPKLKSTGEEEPVTFRKTSIEEDSGRGSPSMEHLSSSLESVDTLSSPDDPRHTPITSGSELDESPLEFEPTLLRSEQMSYAQSRFWFLRHSLEDKTAFNITFSHSLKGNAHPDELAKAVKIAAKLHEGLRTCFFEQDNLPMQGILEVSPLYLERRDIDSEDEVKAEYERLSQHVYNLETGQSMRIVLLEQSSRLSYLIVGYHHIAMDGAGFMGFLQELMRIGGGEQVPKPIQYADYSRQMRDDFQSGKMDRELSYWRTQFVDPLPVLPLLPFSKVKVRAPLRSYASSSTSVKIDPVLVARIKRRCRNFQATAFHFYLAVFKTMLFRFLNIDDLCIGIADSNRSDAELQRTMGILVNLLPLRFKSKLEMTFGEAVKEARKTTYGALENSKVPFNALLDSLTVERSASHFPIFQVFVDYRQGVQECWTLGDVEVQRLDWSYGNSPYDINLDIMENTSGTAFITINAQESLYGQAEVETLMKVFINLLEAFSRNPALHLNEPTLFSESDIQSAIELGKGPDLPSDWAPTLSHRVEEIAQTHPETLAVKDGEGNQLTYGELIEETHKIAHVLSDSGVVSGDRVAVFQQATATTISSLLAIMQVGAVYVPLDLRSPIPRLTAILQDCQPRAILYHAATESLVSTFPVDNVKLINASTISGSGTAVASNSAAPDAEAVILYTSGSTGTPKGVILPHSVIRNVIEVLTKQYNLGAEVVLQQSALTFDLSLNQIFVALANGGTLHVVGQTKRGDAVEITRLIEKEGITYTMTTPSEYSYWIRFGAGHLQGANKWRLAFSAGEELKPGLTEEFRSLKNPDLRLINTYGPAEITVHSHAIELLYHEPTREVIPVGHSLPNYSTYIVDEALKPVPLGMPGEICVGGAGVTRGYLNLEGLTQERFIPNSSASADWITKGWDKMYLTGDRGRLRPDGALLFEGRIDGNTQIKLRGMRIELGEIEHAIFNAASPVLAEAVVSVRGDPEFLVAHVVFSPDDGIEDRQSYLNQILNQLPLPQYMVPAMIIPLDRIPLTSHNKTDRKAIAALPLPMEVARVEGASGLTPLETELVQVWEIVLSTDLHSGLISPDSSFFHVGGNSLLLIPLQYMIKDKFQASLAMTDFAEAHTVRKMAARIEQTASARLIDWAAETAIPDNLPIPQSAADLPRKVGTDLRVLYTGATGHSARFVLKKLVEDERISKIYCIAVRSSEKQPAPRELSVTSDKIVQFPGSLLDERLGLSEEQFNFLAGEVDVIIHSAANRSFWDNYQVMKQSNVLPAQTLVSLAISRKIPIHFMSSAAIHLFSGKTDEDYPETQAVHQPPADGKEGYLASKWAAEKLFENASSQFNLPVYIHRPAPVGQVQRLSKETVFAEFMRVARELRLHIPRDSIRGDIDLLDLTQLSGVLRDSIIGSTAEGGDSPLVRYIHHHADMKLHLNEWDAYVDEHRAELEIDMLETQNATEWIGRAKRIGFPYMLAAQNFDLTGDSTLPIVQRR
ncbi:lovastatin nonaketide synthase [Aspergillus cavernicola]|uniref:Lovastatin nonaketide synthase n=1 Tax=Aspergillus cavernicola TaxID=176166 RepID=A0ABR4HVU9_9EURO